MLVNDFELGKSYTYDELLMFADTYPPYVLEEYGRDHTGRGFIVLEDNEENFYSFVSDGWGSNGTSYKCIYIG